MPTIESATLGSLATTGTEVNLTYPATVNAGDLIIGVVAQKDDSSDASGESFTTPSGWTAGPAGAADYSGQFAVFYRTADGDEASTTDTVTSSLAFSTAIGRGVLLRISDHGGWDTAAGNQATAAGGTFDSPTITPNQDNALIITVLATGWDGTTVSPTHPSGYSDDYTYGSTFQPVFGIASLSQTTAVATGALSWTTLVTNIGTGAATISVAPAASGPSIPILTHHIRQQS